MGEADMKVIGQLIWETATDFDAKADAIRETVAGLCGKYPLYE
jgi:glycine hydroxymethyltransferase